LRQVLQDRETAIREAHNLLRICDMVEVREGIHTIVTFRKPRKSVRELWIDRSFVCS
jgi:hypothetical protein